MVGHMQDNVAASAIACVGSTDCAGRLIALVIKLMRAVHADMVGYMQDRVAASVITCAGGADCADKLIALMIQPMCAAHADMVGYMQDNVAASGVTSAGGTDSAGKLMVLVMLAAVYSCTYRHGPVVYVQVVWSDKYGCSENDKDCLSQDGAIRLG